MPTTHDSVHIAPKLDQVSVNSRLEQPNEVLIALGHIAKRQVLDVGRKGFAPLRAELPENAEVNEDNGAVLTQEDMAPARSGRKEGGDEQLAKTSPGKVMQREIEIQARCYCL